MYVRFVVAFWFAEPWTPHLWQRGFFLVNCFVLRRLLASARSGVVKTFRWTTSTIENPYESPTSTPQPVVAAYPVARISFAFVNFAVAVLFSISCVISVAAPESPFQFLGGLMFAAPIAFYALCEWLVLFRRRVSTERKLGIANLACAAFATFGVVTNVGEAVMSDDPPGFQFLFWFTLIGACITAYLIASGWCRLRWTRST